MNNPKDDIALIRKYHNGTLSPTEKNKLEARALDDVFLQDALDGYEELGVKDEEIKILYKNLADRIAPAKIITPVWGVKQWGIAASILLCIALGSIYFNQNPNDQTIALNDIQQKEDIPKAEKLKIAPPEHTDSGDLNSLSTISLPAEIAKSTALRTKEEDIYSTDQDIVVEPLANVSAHADSSTALEEVTIATSAPTLKKQELAGAVAGMVAENLMASRMMRVDKAEQTVKLSGKIVDGTDGTVIPGASVKNLETGVAKQADVNGVFSIDATNGDGLVFNYLGYETKKIVVQKQDSILISLKPDLAALNQVVVVGYGSPNAIANNKIGPKVGWRNFKNYVDEQAQLANIGRGKVQLQFVINTNGELSDFKIIATFSEKASVAAINIIKNYNSGWAGSTEKIPHLANITIKFK
ncbi:carboxypeptidase-like regulatory domain-containing protein [Pedobacter arcticus]|uniref:carboxypeptidase-like regulatory domain-containing protein n=1 Tax=Pedobacter arcticus TaxID=752140 RepID=UPI0002F6155F|nr:carboxypeptidase-like regulatory domain-containing protein [Pedobacter arcticus]